jgi:hypothetical protein
MQTAEHVVVVAALAVGLAQLWRLGFRGLTQAAIGAALSTARAAGAGGAIAGSFGARGFGRGGGGAV